MNMKKLLLSVVVATACFSLNANATMQDAKQFKFVGDTQYSGFCEAVITDNVDLFKNNIVQLKHLLSGNKREVLETVLKAKTISCSEQNLVSFSQQRNATNILAFIASVTAPEQIEQAQYKFMGDKNFASFCKAALTNNVDLFKRSIRNQVGILARSKSAVMDLVLDSNNVTCAGQGLKEFSGARQATDVVNYISNAKA
ncbi:MAG: hypothetical protein ACJA13_002381 [Paraglaciecola sp.]|jgi:hypothetical protein